MNQNWLNFRKKLAASLLEIANKAAQKLDPQLALSKNINPWVLGSVLPAPPLEPTMAEIFAALKIHRPLSEWQSAAVPDRVVISPQGVAFKTYRMPINTLRDITSFGFRQTELNQVQLVQSLIALGITDIEIKE